MAPPIQGLHLEPTNICTLKCAGCARTRFIEQWPQHWRNHNLDIETLMRFIDIDLTDVEVDLCGNYGDPIYHPDFAKLIANLKNRGAIIQVTTNGSFKLPGWWKTWLDYLNSKDEIVFSIDGTPENFTQYRVNGDWDSIKKAIETCVAAKVRTVWKFIPFAFNQDHMESAKKLAFDLGMTDFLIDPSDRFDHRTQTLKPKIELLAKSADHKEFFRPGTSIQLEPKCGSGKYHFVSAAGFYAPCCFVSDHRFYFKTVFGKSKQWFDIKNHTLTQLLAEPQTMDFFSQIMTNGHDVCRHACPKISS